MRLPAAVSATLIISWTLISCGLAAKQIGIQRDTYSAFDAKNPDGIFSYSAVIEFQDRTIPGDKSKMSDAQFANLAFAAYDEMVSAAPNTKVQPGGMIALESKGLVYFASSVKGSRNNLDLYSLFSDVKDSVGWFMTECNKNNEHGHGNQGACAEPNVLRLYGDMHPLVGAPPTGYEPPPVTATSPRMAVVVNSRNNVENVGPCQGRNGGYGCQVIVDKYQLKPITGQNRDGSMGPDNWAFDTLQNPRSSPCTIPPGEE